MRRSLVFVFALALSAGCSSSEMPPPGEDPTVVDPNDPNPKDPNDPNPNPNPNPQPNPNPNPQPNPNQNAPAAVAIARPSVGGAAPFTVVLDGSRSSDPENDIASYTWSFGDGTPDGTEAYIEHTYTTAGTFEAVLTVTDATGLSGTDSVSVVVTAPECKEVSNGAQLGTVATPNLPEVSGMVASRTQPGILWTHNDSGDGARVYAINTQGDLLMGYELSGITAVDWEDIAIGPGPIAGRDYLYVGDIGDNDEEASVAVVHRFLEPTVPSGQPVLYSVNNVEVIGFEYANGATHNAEALLVDPLSGDVLIFSKSATGISRIYRSRPPFNVGQVNPTELLGSIDFSIPGYARTGQVTAGDISPSGDRILIRTYNVAYFWHRAPGTDISTAFGLDACLGSLAPEPQGESIAFLPNGAGYYTLSEGDDQPVYQFMF